MCSNCFFPASEAPPPPRPEALWPPQTRYEMGNRATTIVPQDNRKVRCVPTLEREDATIGAVSESKEPATKRKRTISERELRDLYDGHSGPEQSPDGSKRRLRKPPRRYGQDE